MRMKRANVLERTLDVYLPNSPALMACLGESCYGSGGGHGANCSAK